MDCQDVHSFIRLLNCSGIASKDGEEIGKVVRFYKSTETDTAIVPLFPNKAGLYPKVATSDGCNPLMDYPNDMRPPADTDRDWYVVETMARMCYVNILEQYTHIYLFNGVDYTFAELGELGEQLPHQYDRVPFIDFLTGIGVTKKDIKHYKIVLDHPV